MSIFRSYFSKNNTLIKDNLTNNSQNPVTELIYGTEDAIYSRFIFKFDLTDLISKISTESISITKIQKHELNITNTIAVRNDLIGAFMTDEKTRRASSFQLRLFVVPEDWDEGSGYEFYYDDNQLYDYNRGASNWTERKTGLNWTIPGAVNSTGMTVIATQTFDKGNENIKMDITNFINNILYSGATYNGLGLAFSALLESGTTLERYSVGFHTKYTHTFFEPYVETTINDTVIDDRKYFYLDKSNKLVLVSKKGGTNTDVTVNSVKIYDHNDVLVSTITGTSITKARTGIYFVTTSVNSSTYPDAVLFKDVWNVTDSSGKTKDITQSFYLRHQDEYYAYNQIVRFHPDNVHFSYIGLGSNEILKLGEKRRVSVTYKQLYASQDIPFELEYRLYTKQGGNLDIVVVPYTKVDRILSGYEFLIDTSWMVPGEYYLDLKMLYDGVFMVKNPIKFRVQSETQNFTVL